MIVSALLLAAVHAQDMPRIAVVDVTRIFEAHPETTEAEKALESKRSDARKAVNAKSDELKRLLQKHQEVTTKLIAAGSGADQTLKSEANELLTRAARLEREVATLQTTLERDLEQEFVRERRRIISQIRKAIESYNRDAIYAVVLDRSAASANGIPQVLHAPGAEDITDEILAIFTKGGNGE